MARIVAVLAVLQLAAGCGGGPGSGPDDAGARDASRRGDAAIPPDGAQVLSFVDFAVTGCEASSAAASAGGQDVDANADADAGPEPSPPCLGHVPLALGFNAISPAAIDTYIWRFGDGGEDTAALPSHVYDDPGSYDVSLIVGGPSGTATADRPGAVVALPALLGHACVGDAQCGDRECVCDGQTACAPNLEGGLCSEACTAQTGCAEGVCARLAPAAVAAPEDWQRDLCLVACEADADCPGSHRCTELLDAAGAWTRACFADGVLAPNGASCAGADGGFDDAACAGGRCVPEGARGMCASPCTPGSCPESSACATFAAPQIGAVCVLRCEEATDCAGDPRLACEAPGGTGAKRFTVDEPAAAGGYCAPKRCQDVSECGADGACVGGFCAPGA